VIDRRGQVTGAVIVFHDVSGARAMSHFAPDRERVGDSRIPIASLARLWRDQHRVGAAHELLSAVRARFGEGLQTRDYLKADALLQELC